MEQRARRGSNLEVDSVCSTSRPSSRSSRRRETAEGHGSDRMQQGQAIYISSTDVHRTVAESRHMPSSMRRDTWQLEQFDLKRELYRGKTSAVFLAMDKVSGMEVVLKLYRKRKLTALNRRQVEREIRIHSTLEHDHIIRLFAAFEDKKLVYLVLEHAGGGDLFERLRTKGQLSELQTVEGIIGPLLKALCHLHANDIVHRDIKPENILLSSTNTVKLADFGMAIDMTKERPVTRVGTLDYLAPEVLACPDKTTPDENKDVQHLAYNTQVDTWAIGILAYELLVGYPPFEHESRTETYNNIMFADPMFPTSMSPDARQFIRSALCKDPSSRPSVSELCNHAWLSTRVSPAPSLRRSAETCNPARHSSALHEGFGALRSSQEAACSSASTPVMLYGSTASLKASAFSTFQQPAGQSILARVQKLTKASDPGSHGTPLEHCYRTYSYDDACATTPSTSVLLPQSSISYSSFGPGPSDPSTAEPLIKSISAHPRPVSGYAGHASMVADVPPAPLLPRLSMSADRGLERSAVQPLEQAAAVPSIPAWAANPVNRPLSAFHAVARTPLSRSGPMSTSGAERPNSGYVMSMSKHVMPLSWSGIPQSTPASSQPSLSVPAEGASTLLERPSVGMHRAMALLSLQERLSSASDWQQVSSPKREQLQPPNELLFMKRAKFAACDSPRAAPVQERVLPFGVDSPACPSSPGLKRLASAPSHRQGAR